MARRTMTIFEAVKESVTARQAADLYGFALNRSGMMNCLFHSDKNPSMWVNEGFFCHGCGARGDVIDFTAQAFGMSQKDAALKLASDFGIIYDNRNSTEEIKRHEELSSLRDQYKVTEQQFLRIATGCCRKLRGWIRDFSPQDPEHIDERFLIAQRFLPEIEHMLDEYSEADLRGKIEIINSYGRRVMELAGR